MTAKAVRTTKNDNATIAVTLPDGTTKNVGGARAARAAVVVLYTDPRGPNGTDRWRVLGVRQDVEAGHSAARTAARPWTHSRHAGYESETLVVSVEDAV